MTHPPPPESGSSLPSHSDRLFNGTLWMVAMRWGMRLVGLISIAVLARLLDKEDFGLVAMSMAMVALPQALLEMGAEQAVIRERTPDAATYNTAWTIRAGQMALIAGLLFAAAPWIARFYDEARIVEIVQVLALVVFIKGLENIWVVAFRKAYDFRRDFLFNMLCKVLAVVVTVVLAFWLRSYWALVYGQLSAAVLRVTLSFAMAPGVARPTLVRWRLIWSFSQWSLVKGLAVYVVDHGDRLALGRMTGTETVGAYTLAREIAAMPISEIAMPVNRALAPGFSSLQSEPVRLAKAIAKSIGAVSTVLFPIAVGLALTAEHLVPVALGPGWTEVVPLLQLLAVSALFAGVRAVLGNTLTVIGHIRTAAVAMWMRAAMLVAFGIPAVMALGGLGMAGAFLVSEALALAILLGFFRHHVPALSFRALAAAMLRPAVAVGLMAAVVTLVARVPSESAILLLTLEGAAGVLTYGVVLLTLWILQGRPDGLERMAVTRLPAPRRLRVRLSG